MAHWSIQAAGPQALIIRFGNEIDAAITPVISAARDRLATQLAGEFIELLPGYTTLMVTYDVLKHDFTGISALVNDALQDLTVMVSNSRLLEIPVFYDPEVGWDLQRVADHHAISIDDVIRRHSNQIYQVFAIGFAPGFAYLGNVADNLATPRLDSPRRHVPEGAVAIADKQTAVYPLATPGGWNIIGRTHLKMLDRDLPDLCPLKVGDKVRFIPVSREVFLAAGGKLR